MDLKIRIYTIFCFLIITNIACKNNKTDGFYLISPGIGFEEFQVKKVTSKFIIEKLGTRYNIDSHYVDIDPFVENLESMTDYNKELFSISYTWDTLGLSFYFKPQNDTCISICFTKPFKGKTSQNVYLDSSTFNQVIKSYGDIRWLFTKNSIMKDYDSIIFSTDCNVSFPVSDSIQTTYLNKKITEIIIH